MGVNGHFRDGNHAVLMGGIMVCLLGLEKVDYARCSRQNLRGPERWRCSSPRRPRPARPCTVTCRAGMTSQERLSDLEALERSLR